MAHDADAEPLELFEVARHRRYPFAAQTIERPHDEDVELPPMRGSENLSERGSIASCATRCVSIDADDVEAEALRPCAQLALLVFDGLLPCGDADVEACSNHGSRLLDTSRVKL